MITPRALSCLLIALACASCATDNTAPAPKTGNRTALIAATQDAPRGELVGKIDNERPLDLIPGSIPPRVRYKAKPSAVVVKAHDLLGQALAHQRPLFDKRCLIMPGAWKHLGQAKGFVRKESIPVNRGGSGVAVQEGLFWKAPDSAAPFEKELFERLGASPRVRALTSDEMAKWWIYIPFDIEEPIFVIESTDKHYLFIAHVDDEGFVSALDELNALG